MLSSVTSEDYVILIANPNHHQMSQPSDQKVSLGCGTLILIAIIVLIFGNSGSNQEIEEKLNKIEKRLEKIEQKLDTK